MGTTLTHENVEGECCSLPSASLVVASESDDISSILYIIIILLEVCKDLLCTLIQGQ